MAGEDMCMAEELRTDVFPLIAGVRPGLVQQALEKTHYRLSQVNKGTTTLAFKWRGDVIVAVDSRASMGTYISSQTVKKVIEINNRLLGTMAGGAADCTYWERKLGGLVALRELRGEPVSVRAAASLLANMFWSWRGYGLSCGTMVAGGDAKGTHIYWVDDTGAHLEGNMFSCGSGSTFAYGILDTELPKNHADVEGGAAEPGRVSTLEGALDLAKRAIVHAGHRDGASGGLVRVYHVKKEGWKCHVPGNDLAKEWDAISKAYMEK